MITGSKKRRQKEHGRESPGDPDFGAKPCGVYFKRRGIDNRTGGGQDPENMQMGSRIHREDPETDGIGLSGRRYLLRQRSSVMGFILKIEGRADGLIHTKEQVMVERSRVFCGNLTGCRSRQAFIWHRQNVMPAW